MQHSNASLVKSDTLLVVSRSVGPEPEPNDDDDDDDDATPAATAPVGFPWLTKRASSVFNINL